jgi:hypothetical protein
MALAKATVQLIAGQDTLTVLSSDDGNFAFSHVQSGSFRVRITMKGYLSFSQSYAIPEGKPMLTLKRITLNADYNELDPVIVSRVRPITIQDDTVSYNVAAFPVRDGSEVEDILKRLPGVEVDINGNVIVQGKPLTKVLVNGKEFFGSDVLLAIQNLPANVVDKLQIVDDYGDKARLTGVKVGESAKVLNIVLKPDKRNGEFGQVHAAGGNEGKYEGRLFGNSFNGARQFSANAGLGNNNPVGSDFSTRSGLNYADQWDPRWSGAVNINRTTQAPHSDGSSTSSSYYPSEVLQQSSNNSNSSYTGNNNIGGRLTFKPNSYSTLRLTTNGSITQSNNQGSSDFADLQQDSGYTKSTIGRSLNSAQASGRGFNSDIYYEWLSPRSRRRFSVDANMAYSGGNQSGVEKSAATVAADSLSTQTASNYLTSNIMHNLNVGINANYFIPVGPASFLEMGYRVQSTMALNSMVTRQPDSATGVLQAIDSLSEDLILRGLTQDLHAGYTGKLNHFNLSAILDAEPGQQIGTADSKGDVIGYHYLVVLPNLDLAWNITKTRRLRFGYSSNPLLPTIQELSPFTNVSNPQFPVTGNPGLKPAYSDNISLRYEESRLQPTQFFGFGMGLNFTETSHTIIQDLTTPKDSSQVIQTTTWVNAGTTHVLAGDYHLSLPAILDKRLRINYSGGINVQQTITMVNNVQSPTASWTWSQALHLQLLVADLVETDLSGAYSETHTSYSAGRILPVAFQTAWVSWNARYYFLRHWIANFQLNQSYTGNGSRLETVSPTLTASLQRQFLPHNVATVTLSGYNLFNQSAAAVQSMSATTFVQTRPILTGRYFLLGVIVKMQRFQ